MKFLKCRNGGNRSASVPVRDNISKPGGQHELKFRWKKDRRSPQSIAPSDPMSHASRKKTSLPFSRCCAAIQETYGVSNYS